MRKGVPIRPEEIQNVVPIPPEVIDAVNELLTESEVASDGGRVINRADIVGRTLTKLNATSLNSFRSFWFSFTQHFNDSGWKIIEPSRETFTFYSQQEFCTFVQSDQFADIPNLRRSFQAK